MVRACGARIAKQCTKQLTHQEILGDSNMHDTKTASEACHTAASVTTNNYLLVVPMGGDGTLSAWIDNLIRGRGMDWNMLWGVGRMRHEFVS
jgi:diacylglycerol kinase family enzyme